MNRNLICAALLLCIGLVACGSSGSVPQVAGSQSGGDARISNRGADKNRWWDALPRPIWGGLRRISTGADEGWFEVYEVRPGVFAIYEPGQFEEVISYLIIGEQRALLFDTGLGIGDIRSLVTSLTDQPVWILNSHSHYDHIGGNHQFDSILATTSEYTRQRSEGLPNSEVRQYVEGEWVWKPLPSGFDPDQYAIQPFTVSDTIGDGDIIDLGGRRLEVLLTPGHAPDALCLLDRGNRILFTGDTFYPAPLYTHLPGSDFDQYRMTAKRLSGLADELDYLLPGHNEPMADPRALRRMADAFLAIAAGNEEFVITDGNRQYDFGDFSIIVRPQALNHNTPD